MNTMNITALTSKIDSFPTLPTVVNRVMEITANPTSSIQDLMSVISTDIALTSTILKIANSAFFGFSQGVHTLQQAITVLGLKEIRNVIIGKAVFDSFSNLAKDRNIDIRGFWEHSFMCGLMAKIIADDLKKDSNEFFVAGLIHDIGKLVMYLALPVEYSKLSETAGSLNGIDYRTEKTTFGIAHDEVGMRLLKKWLFPQNLVATVGFHHHPHELKNKSPFFIVVHVADLLTHLKDFDKNVDEGRHVYNSESLYPEIISLADSYGIKWDEACLDRFQSQLAESKEKEAAVLSLFQ